MQKAQVHILVAAGVLLTAVALAQELKQIHVTLAGKKLTLDSVAVRGKTYVSLEQLQKALANTTAPGGANQLEGVSGCIGQWLFNGAWRFRVESAFYSLEEKAWVLNVELRNGTKQTRTVFENGTSGQADLSLVLSSGRSLSVPQRDVSDLDFYFFGKSLAPGAGITQQLFFLAQSDTEKAVKFVWSMSLANNQAKAPLAQNATFRVDLSCKK